MADGESGCLFPSRPQLQYATLLKGLGIFTTLITVDRRQTLASNQDVHLARMGFRRSAVRPSDNSVGRPGGKSSQILHAPNGAGRINGHSCHGNGLKKPCCSSQFVQGCMKAAWFQGGGTQKINKRLRMKWTQDQARDTIGSPDRGPSRCSLSQKMGLATTIDWQSPFICCHVI